MPQGQLLGLLTLASGTVLTGEMYPNKVFPSMYTVRLDGLYLAISTMADLMVADQ